MNEEVDKARSVSNEVISETVRKSTENLKEMEDDFRLVRKKLRKIGDRIKFERKKLDIYNEEIKRRVKYGIWIDWGSTVKCWKINFQKYPLRRKR